MWKVLKYVGDDNRVIEICGKIESEISVLESDEEKAEFMEAVGIEESGLDVLIRKSLTHAWFKNLLHRR